MEGSDLDLACSRCGARHRLDAGLALGRARELLATLEAARTGTTKVEPLSAFDGYRAEHRNPVFDPREDSRPLFEAGGGKMFGVLLARTPAGERRTLIAFSGTYAGRWTLPGFVPPLFDVAQWHALEAKYDPGIATLTARLADAGDDRDALAAERARESAALMARYHALYMLVAPDGRAVPMTEIAGERLVSGMGDCCAPRLLCAAHRRGWSAESMVEIFVGVARRPESRPHGSVHAPCELKCGPLLPFLLCDASPGMAE